MTDLILFDEKCPFCQRCMHWIIKKDKRRQFVFSDLHGITAQKRSSYLKVKKKESIIFVENFNRESEHVYYESKAVFKIFWKLGGVYKLIGWKYILPSFLFDWAYQIVAMNRKHLCRAKKYDERATHLQRFLP